MSKDCSIPDKNCEISDPYKFNIQTSVESDIPDAWNWNFWTLLALKIEVEGGGGYGPTFPPVATPLQADKN